MENLINGLTQNIFLKALIIVIVLDTFLGCLRAIKEHKWNSGFGIDGLLRKFAMIGSVAFLMLVDYIINIDFIGFIPADIKGYIGNLKIGISSLFAIIFVLYESTSVLKNMVLCGLPVPKKLKEKVENLLNNLTTELEDKK